MRKTLVARIALFSAVSLLVVAALGLVGCGPKVPDLTGMRQADAVRAIEDAGYKLGEVSAVATQGVALGMIAAQTPAGGERAREGSEIDLAIAFSDGKRTLIPTVLDLEQVTAEGVADSLGLVPMVVEQYSDTAAKGIVAAQSPEPGAEVDSGTTLVMVVSKGNAPAKAKVPDVDGDKQADAEAAIEKAGFVSEVFKVYDSTVAKGAVIAQLPDGGASATVGSKVQVVVSLGKGTGSAKVPAVTGKKEADANKAIQNAGLTVHKVTQYSTSVASGVVIEQFPVAGATASAGSEVLILVSKGKEPADTVAVPDVMGMTAEQATAALEDAGFAATIQELASADASSPVQYQFPVAGTKAAPGSGVLAVVGIAP